MTNWMLSFCPLSTLHLWLTPLCEHTLTTYIALGGICGEGSHKKPHINHYANRFAVGTNRDERVLTSGRLSYKIGLRGKHTMTRSWKDRNGVGKSQRS